jgi:uncharacterized OsmC-like protein
MNLNQWFAASCVRRAPMHRARDRNETDSVTAEAKAMRYSVEATNLPGGTAAVAAHASTIAFDGSAETGELLPGPAALLAAALAACILKNVERFSGLLPFRYEHARVHVELEREEPPPRIVRARYALRILTDEPEQRLELLHRNIVRFGTVTDTLAAGCDVSGTIAAEQPRSGTPSESTDSEDTDRTARSTASP